MLPSAPHHRHQSSLETVINFSLGLALGANQRAQAKKRFNHIINHFQARDNDNGPYKRSVLVRLTYEYACSEESQDIFLQAFFQTITLSIDEDIQIDFNNKDIEEEVYSTLLGFADYLLDNFFLPCKARVLPLLVYANIYAPSKSFYQKDSPALSRISLRSPNSAKRNTRSRRYSRSTISSPRLLS